MNDAIRTDPSGHTLPWSFVAEVVVSMPANSAAAPTSIMAMPARIGVTRAPWRAVPDVVSVASLIVPLSGVSGSVMVQPLHIADHGSSSALGT